MSDSGIKYYVDSDGVIADFTSWVRKFKPEIVGEDGNTKEGCVDALHRLMVERHSECYLTLDVLPGGFEFLDKIRNNDNWFVLTASLSLNKILQIVGDENQARRIYDIFFENKYRWYEKHSVPRSKVIITGHRKDKSKYAQGANVLYDDFIENVEDWRKSGGIAYQIGNRIR